MDIDVAPSSEAMIQESSAATSLNSQTNATGGESLMEAPSSTAMAPPPASGPSRSNSTSSRGGKKTIIAKPKFAGRRSKADREAAEASQAARRVEEPRSKRGSHDARGGLRGGRGGNRGGFMGDFRKRDPSGAPTGVFGSGLVSAEFSRGRGGSTRAIGGPSGGPSGPAHSHGSSSRKVKIKTEGGDESGATYVEISSSESEEDTKDGPKRNIDYIDLRSDSEDNQTNDQPSALSNAKGMQPIRVQRIERKDRNQPSVAKSSKVDRKRALRNLERPLAESNAKGKQRALDDHVDTSEHKWKGVYDDDQDEGTVVNIKTEPILGDGMAPNALHGDSAGHPPSPEERKSRPRKHAGPDLQTEEEREEHERHMQDLDTIVHELGQSSLADADGDAAMADGEHKDDPRAYKVYLFQFPPILPDLKTDAEIAIKKDPETILSPTLSKAVPVATSENDGKAAPEIKSEAAPDEDAKPHHHTRAQTSSGRVGKLRVHESGKVTLDWGGTSLSVGMGTEIEFLQQVVMAKLFEEGRTEKLVGSKGPTAHQPEPVVDKDARSDITQPPGFVGGEVMALGQVRGKFVVTPNWEEII